MTFPTTAQVNSLIRHAEPEVKREDVANIIQGVMDGGTSFVTLDNEDFSFTPEANHLFPTTGLIRCQNTSIATVNITADLRPLDPGRYNTLALQLEGDSVRVAPVGESTVLPRAYSFDFEQVAYGAAGTDLDVTVGGAGAAPAGTDRLAVIDIVVYGYEGGTLDNLQVTASGPAAGPVALVRHNPANSLTVDNSWNGPPHRATAFIPLGSSGSAQTLSVRVQGDQNVYTASVAMVIVTNSRQAPPFTAVPMTSEYAIDGFGSLAGKTVPFVQDGTVGVRFMHARRFEVAAVNPGSPVTDPEPASGSFRYTPSGLTPANRFRDQMAVAAAYEPDGDALPTSIVIPGGDAESRIVSTTLTLPPASGGGFDFPPVTITNEGGGSRVAWVQIYQDTVRVIR